MKKIIDFQVKANQALNEETFLLTLYSPELPEIEPGQFVNVRVDHSQKTFLRRPLSVHDVDPEQGVLYLFVKQVGEGTHTLGQLQSGDSLNVILPLGNSFNYMASGKTLLIGGGCGVAPLLYLARKLKAIGNEPKILLGTRSSKDILRLETYAQYGEVYLTTEDGSAGEQGYPTQHSVLEQDFDTIFCCGPEPMMKAVAGYAAARGINCYVSLENTMACGIGACLCCVTETTSGNQCVCTEGPIFNIKDLTWQI